MPADFSDYVDLRLHDASPTDIYLGAIELARLTLPEFALRSGTVEDALFQSMSYMQMLSVAAINRLPSRLMEGLMKIGGVERDAGSRSVITVNFVLNEVTSLTIPIGSTFFYEIDFGDEQVLRYSYMTTETVQILDTDIPAGETLPQKELTLTSQYVGLHILPAVGSELQSETVFPDMSEVTFVSHSSVGSNPEDDETFLSRCVDTIASYSNSNITANQIRRYVLTSQALVSRCKVYDLTSSYNTNLYPIEGEPVTGSVLVFVYGSERFLTALERSTIAQDIQSRALAGLTIEVVNMILADDFDIEAYFTVGPDVDSATVRDELATEIAAYLSPSGYTSTAEGLVAADIASIIRNHPQVAFVNSVAILGDGTYTAASEPAYAPWLVKGTIPNVDPTRINLTAIVSSSIQSTSIEAV
ncbi:MAG: baseplate J/gp47 family protein [Bacteroidetes bacterium]|nr:baseplate J/gp47 family protein [Bacteroidota bacterium]